MDPAYQTKGKPFQAPRLPLPSEVPAEEDA